MNFWNFKGNWKIEKKNSSTVLGQRYTWSPRRVRMHSSTVAHLLTALRRPTGNKVFLVSPRGPPRWHKASSWGQGLTEVARWREGGRDGGERRLSFIGGVLRRPAIVAVGSRSTGVGRRRWGARQIGYMHSVDSDSSGLGPVDSGSLW
jgi:hypothetical protein